MKILVSNKTYCKNCDTEIESTFTHDFVSCKCGDAFVDGGLSYRRGGGNLSEQEDRSVWCNEDDWECIAKNLKWGSYGKDGKGPLVRKPLIELETDHLKNILRTQTQIRDVVRNTIEKIILNRKEENNG